MECKISLHLGGCATATVVKTCGAGLTKLRGSAIRTEQELAHCQQLARGPMTHKIVTWPAWAANDRVLHNLQLWRSM